MKRAGGQGQPMAKRSSDLPGEVLSEEGYHQQRWTCPQSGEAAAEVLLWCGEVMKDATRRWRARKAMLSLGFHVGEQRVRLSWLCRPGGDV